MRFNNVDDSTYVTCPYGAPGDRLWVRETWGPLEGGFCYRADEHPNARPDGGLWRPSIFMPRWASRLTLEVQAVRVERVQEISDDDIQAEGVVLERGPRGEYLSAFDGSVHETPRDLWRAGWDSLNAKRGFGWSENPYVWVVTFKRVEDQHGR